MIFEVWGGRAPSPEFFFNFYIKLVSFCAFWVAISCYCLAACFNRIGSTSEIEIYWRSFYAFGTIITPSRKLRANNDNNAPKIT